MSEEEFSESIYGFQNKHFNNQNFNRQQQNNQYNQQQNYSNSE